MNAGNRSPKKAGPAALRKETAEPTKASARAEARDQTHRPDTDYGTLARKFQIDPAADRR
jgi:hypothetical protein